MFPPRVELLQPICHTVCKASCTAMDGLEPGGGAPLSLDRSTTYGFLNSIQTRRASSAFLELTG